MLRMFKTCRCFVTRYLTVGKCYSLESPFPSGAANDKPPTVVVRPLHPRIERHTSRPPLIGADAKAMLSRDMSPARGTSRNASARSVACTGPVVCLALDKASGTSSLTVGPAVTGPEYRAVNTPPSSTGSAVKMPGPGVDVVGAVVSDALGTSHNSLVVMSGNTSGGFDLRLD